jgi:small-conductance mechanosensitive channel
MVRGMGFLSQRLLSPRLPLLRPLPLDDGTAASIYSWAVRLLTVAGLGLLIHVFMELERASEALVVTVRSVTGLAVVTLFFFALWQHRRAISARIRTASSGNANQSAAFRERLARTWLFFTAPYLAGLWAIWVLYTLMEQVDELIPILALWLSVPFFLAANGILQKLLDAAFSMSVPRGGSPCEATALEVGEGEEATPRPPAAEEVRGAIDVSRHVRILRRLLSFSIGAAIFFRLMALWGFDVELGHHIATATTRASIAILLAFVTWKLIETAISRRLREVEPFDALDDEHEMGGEGGSRIGTLLYLLRKFVLIGLFCAVTLIVLAALGVNITPLLAGAGVIGLAIGFGSQTLVKDIVSGIFYLIDDAFRIGDYVDTGKLQGTVEHISIRSFKLRHARGQVHTIPFSSLSSVTNFSRDYTIEKIRFRVPFDTDLKKVKKIIKKINVDIREDTEMASILLGDIKSQGVREVDDSALVMRIKFKTRPGGQFIIRREVYDRLKKAFEKAGLEFAHRHVVVRLPHEAPTAAAATTDTAAAPAAQGALAAGAGAAIAQALVMEELERKTKGEGEP